MSVNLKYYLPSGLKTVLKKLPVRFTKNQQYDYQTKKIINEVLNDTSNTIDVGCFRGEILDLFIDRAPNGNHFAIEPIPDNFKNLLEKYRSHNRVKLFNMAASDTEGKSSFNHVISNPSYSGLKKRDYDLPNEVDQQITVDTNLLDNVIPKDLKIDLIKIDVEGAEYLVMQGAQKLIRQWKPIIIFEHGLGGSNHYGNGPNKVFEFLKGCDLQISNLNAYIQKKSPISKEDFGNQYFKKLNYYFIAHP
jgi:FkbM family methyltransferase